jgi:hypothetical protein
MKPNAETRATLTLAKAQIAKQENWMKGLLVSPADARAGLSCLCTLGAVAVATDGLPSDAFGLNDMLNNDDPMDYVGSWEARLPNLESNRPDSIIYAVVNSQPAIKLVADVIIERGYGSPLNAAMAGIKDYVGIVWRFNDSPETTHDRVMEVFDLAIAKTL